MRALTDGWPAAVREIDAHEAATLTTADTVRDRDTVPRFFAVFRAECVTKM